VENRPGQYITFRIARQDFAMSASRIRGLLQAHEVTPLDHIPSWICGVASIKGHDFPVVDLRGKLGIAHGSHGRQPCVVVVEVGSGGCARLAGFVADRISDIITLRERDFRKGNVRTTGRTRRLLDPEEILTEDEAAGFWRALPHL
jgi:purine-binding chemotaxis protein CheW